MSNRTTLSFLILRKSTRLLKEYISSGNDSEVRSQRRKYIIGIKEELASLPPEQYSLIKTIATEIDRFIIKSTVCNYIKSDNDEYHKVQYLVQGTNIIVREELQRKFLTDIMWTNIDFDDTLTKNTVRGQPPSKDPWILYDKIHNIYFFIYDNKTVVDNVDLFSGREHAWFVGIFNALKEMKIAEEEIIKQQRILEELRQQEQRKAGILSKYS